jgi:hypothetical protein
MSPEDIKPEWVDKAKYAIERWFDMNQPVPTGAVRDALAAVLPDVRKAAWSEGFNAAVDAGEPANVWLAEWDDITNPYREGSPS